MPKVAELARVTARAGAVWRVCGGCGVLSAMPSEIDRCDACRGELVRGRS